MVPGSPQGLTRRSPPLASPPPAVVLMCGLPASGKTTTAGLLHACLGGVLIRSCDVYQALGISLPEWVQRTQGFTRDVAAYDEARDAAYREMGRRLEQSLRSGAALTIVDAVHGEAVKRQAVYEICAARAIHPVLLWCRCDDLDEISRRFAARRGREGEPELEASDLSVYRDIARRWEPPWTDQLPDRRQPAIVTYDTLTGTLAVAGRDSSSVTGLIGRALTPVTDRISGA